MKPRSSPGEVARRGVEGTGRALPHRERIEERLEHDFSSVRAHTGSGARAACESLGAKAYTVGNQIAFKEENPDAALVAHEATHVLQGSPGAQPSPESVSSPEDPQEQEAEAVARAIENGGTVRPIRPGPVGSASGDGMIRRYAEIPADDQSPDQWNAGDDLRVSEDGRMAVRQSGGYGSHDAWAESAIIASANATLQQIGSVIRLDADGPSIHGTAPDGSGRKTHAKARPKNLKTATGGDAMRLWADCGKSARDVMGAGAGTGEGYEKMTAVYSAAARDLGWWEKFLAMFGRKQKRTEKETSSSSPASMKMEIWKDLHGGTAEEAKARYDGMSAAQKEAFDKEAGINRYAAPGVGEGYTMSSGGKDYPGSRTWNFHWAGVVMTSGADRVTLENYAVGDPSVQNSDWEFQMYGSPSRPGQTFHEQHKATRQHGDQPTTMRVRKR